MTDDTPAQPAEPSFSPLRVIRSDSFVEKASLLVLTALLSGMVIPLVVKAVDSAREEREALSRAQAKLFDDVSETVFALQTLILDVSWYGTPDARNGGLQRKAFERYSERSIDLIAKGRAQSSRAQTLASPQVSRKLDAFQLRNFKEQDTPMIRQWNDCGTACDWQTLHRKNEAMLIEANALIAELANDFGLVKR